MIFIVNNCKISFQADLVYVEVYTSPFRATEPLLNIKLLNWVVMVKYYGAYIYTGTILPHLIARKMISLLVTKVVID